MTSGNCPHWVAMMIERAEAELAAHFRRPDELSRRQADIPPAHHTLMRDRIHHAVEDTRALIHHLERLRVIYME